MSRKIIDNLLSVHEFISGNFYFRAYMWSGLLGKQANLHETSIVDSSFTHYQSAVLHSLIFNSVIFQCLADSDSVVPKRKFLPKFINGI